MLGLEFPPINDILRWQDLFPTFNKIALIACLAALIGMTIYLLAGRKDGTTPPTGVRNVAEIVVEFIEDQIVMQTIGRAGLRWTPFLLTTVRLHLPVQRPGVIPILQMPATARMAIPLFLALMVWVVFNVRRLATSDSATSDRPDLAAAGCRWPCGRWSGSSSSCRTSSSDRSPRPSDSSPTCSPATCCW